MQVATPDAVFLLDLLTLCGDWPSSVVLGACLPGTPPEPSGMAFSGSSDGISSSSSSAEGGSSMADSPAGSVSKSEGWGSQGQQQQGGSGVDTDVDTLPPLQARLSGLLLRMFGDSSIVKAGFGLQTDIARLCESYPWLPCFGAEGPVPLRWALPPTGRLYRLLN